MTSNKHALILTGELLSGFTAAQTWPALAAFFRIEPQRLQDDVLARVPIALKESDDLARLEELQSGASAVGAVIEIHAIDADGSVFVLLDNTPRGPLPRSFVAQRIGSGAWPATLRVAAVGSSQWAPFSTQAESGEASMLPPPVALAMASPPRVARTEWPDSTDTLGHAEPLPPGAAIHAGFWRRTAAYLIDTLILLIPSLILNLIPFLGILTYMVGRWLYFALMESSLSQATLGKRAMGLSVTNGNGQRISFGQASGRYFGGAVSTITLNIGYFLAGWTVRKQALHDLMADTFVVFDSVKPGAALPTVRPPMPWYGWLVNIVLLSVAPIGILAAIALPAYQDYVTRAKVIAFEGEVSPWKIEVAEARAVDQACPSARKAGVNRWVESVQLAGEAPDCTITLTVSSAAEVPGAISGQTIEWTYSEGGAWTCTSTMASKYLPESCR